MKAAMRDRYGTPDVVELRDVPVPVPAEGEVVDALRHVHEGRARSKVIIRVVVG